LEGESKICALNFSVPSQTHFVNCQRMCYNRGGDGKPRGFGFSGFQINRDRDSQLPPPPSSAISKHGYSTMSAISQNALAASYGLPRKRSKTEEE
jgi:ATP-dependent RNA helicase DDX42